MNSIYHHQTESYRKCSNGRHIILSHFTKPFA